MPIKTIFILIIFCLTSLTHAEDLNVYKQQWADTLITTKIRTKFTQNKYLNPLKISVKTKKGVVTLVGHAKNNSAYVEALRIVTHIKGVRAINTSAFDIKSVNSSFTDAYITAQIEAAILKAKVLDDESIPLVGINASTVNGIVTLSGQVKNKKTIDALLKRVHKIHGVKKIRSHLTTTRDLS